MYLCLLLLHSLQALELIAEYARLKFGQGSYELTDPSTPAAERHAAVLRFNAAAAAAGAGQDADMAEADGSAAAAAAEGDEQQRSKKAGIQPKQPFLFLMTPRSIGLGTELPGLSAAIIYESDWHPKLDLQALHRWVWLRRRKVGRGRRGARRCTHLRETNRPKQRGHIWIEACR